MAVVWLTSPCVIERMMASLSVRRAKSGKCSPMSMPGTTVEMGWNSPRISAGASGFRSHVS